MDLADGGGRYKYAVTLEDDMLASPDFYLYHLSLQGFAERNPYVNSVSPAATSRWYICTAPDLQWHLDGDWSRSSHVAGASTGTGLGDMQALATDDAVMPWGNGYTRRYVMTLLAMYLGQELSDKVHLLTNLRTRVNFVGNRRYDNFGNMFAAGASSGRLALTPISARLDGDPKYGVVWNFSFPRFPSCNHTHFYLADGAEGKVQRKLFGDEPPIIRNLEMEVYDRAQTARYAGHSHEHGHTWPCRASADLVQSRADPSSTIAAWAARFDGETGSTRLQQCTDPLVVPSVPHLAAVADCRWDVRPSCSAPQPAPPAPQRCQRMSLRRMWRVNTTRANRRGPGSVLLLGSSLDRNALKFLCDAAGAAQRHDTLLNDSFYGAFWCSVGDVTVAWALLFGSEAPPYWKLPSYMVGGHKTGYYPMDKTSSHDFIQVNATAFALRAFQVSAPSMVVVASSNWDLSSWWRAGGTRPHYRPPEHHFDIWCNHSLPTIVHAASAAFPDSRIAYRTAPAPYGEEPGRARRDFQRMAACARAVLPRTGHGLVDWHAEMEAMMTEGAQLDALYPQQQPQEEPDAILGSLNKVNHIHPGPAASLRYMNLLLARL